jgi:hypothetical protein
MGKQLGLVLGECRAQGPRSENMPLSPLGCPNKRPQHVPPRWGRFFKRWRQCHDDKAEGQRRRWRLKSPLVVKDCQTSPAEAGCACLGMLMNFDYWGAVNFFAIIIGH